jgi:uncharacterized protein YfaS (alpha-2-macroglobulin family)
MRTPFTLSIKHQNIYISLALMINALGWLSLHLPEKQEGQLAVFSLISPYDANVQDRSEFCVRFDVPMVDESRVGQMSSSSPLSLEPYLRGDFYWESREQLRFIPSEDWRDATTYRLLPNPEWIGGRDTPRMKQHELMLKTPELSVTSISQINYVRGQSADIRIAFNSPVSPSACGEYLKVTDQEGNPLNYTFHSDQLSEEVTIHVTPIHSDRAMVTVMDGLQGAVGPDGMTKPYSKMILLNSDIKLSDVIGELNGLGPGYISLRSNYRLDLASAVDGITVEPEAGKLSLERRYSNRYMISGDFKPGQSYRLTISSSLKGENGATLPDVFQRQVYFGDADPALNVRSSGHYLSPHSPLVLSAESMNVQKINITAFRVYENNLVHLTHRQEESYRGRGSYLGEFLSEEVGSLSLDVETPKNTTALHEIDLTQVIKAKAGAYYLRMQGVGEHTAHYDHFLVVSDIGLTCKVLNDQLLVWANSLRHATAVDGAKIRLYSETNQLIDEKQADEHGLVLFDGCQGGKPYLITAEKNDDLSYLALTDMQVPLHGQGVSRRPYLTSGYEAFVFSDRDMIRPGETLHARAILRDSNFETPHGFPVEFVIVQPDRSVLNTVRSMVSERGGANADFTIPDYAPLGKYTLKMTLAGSEKELGSTQINVEEFVPAQIRVEASMQDPYLSATGSIDMAVSSHYLFGASAQELPANAWVVFSEQSFNPKEWADYHFGYAPKPFGPVTTRLGVKKLDKHGKAEFKAEVVDSWKPTAALRAVFGVTVTEFSGRGVTDYASRTIHPYPYYIGLKHDLGAADQRLLLGDEYRYSIVSVMPSGEAYEGECRLSYTIHRLSWESILKKDSDGYYRYISQCTEQDVQAGHLSLTNGISQLAFTPKTPGQYRLVISDDTTGAASSLTTDVNAPGAWQYSWQSGHPDRLDLSLDKPVYQSGDVAGLLVKAPFAGRLLVCTSAKGIQTMDVIEMTNNTVSLTIPINQSHYPNLYCSISLIRPVTPEKHWNAHRASGLISIPVQDVSRHLVVHAECPSSIKPLSQLKAMIQVNRQDGTPAGAEVTVAAIDEGVLMLSDFQTPDPESWFSQERGSSLKQYDIYNYLLPLVDDQIGQTASRPGGGGLGRGARGRMNPIKARRFTYPALWSGVLSTDDHGRVEVEFSVPEFTGALRLMVVASAKESQSGTYSRLITVKRPFVVQSSLPRILAPMDRFKMPLLISNESQSTGIVEVAVNLEGPLSLDNGQTDWSQSVHLEPGHHKDLELDLNALDHPGVSRVIIDATMGEERYHEAIELAVRPPNGRSTRFGSGRLDPATHCRFELPDSWLKNSDESRLWISSLPSVAMVEGLQYLNRYPYGCLEQTTSRSFPLLYLDDMAAVMQPGSTSHEEIAAKVNAGLDRIASMQRDDGSFGLWSKQSPAYPWGSIYACHFMTEAMSAGYTPRPEVYNQACAYLEQWVASNLDTSESSQSQGYYDLSYAVYVLALAGKKPVGWIQRLKEHKTRLDQAGHIHLAGALLAVNHRRDAMTILKEATAIPMFSNRDQIAGSLRSRVRDQALLLSSWIHADPSSDAIPSLALMLDKERLSGKWYTTQSTGMGLMAMGKYCRLVKQTRRPLAAAVSWSGSQEQAISGDDIQHIEFSRGTSGSVDIHNKGEGTLYYGWESSGIDTQLLPEVSRGLYVTRRIFDLSENPILDGTFKHGELYIVQLIIDPDKHERNNIVIEDLLPAGLEIENESLATSAIVPWIAQHKPSQPEHQEARDDRMLLFPGRFSQPRTYYYAVRAVTKGEFIYPAVSAECMYDPEIFCRTSPGHIQVIDEKEHRNRRLMQGASLLRR